MEFFGLPAIPSVKPSVKLIDYTVLEQLFTEVNDFTQLSKSDQLSTLKIHLIKLGSLRRQFYKSQRVLFRDQTMVNTTIPDDSFDQTVNATAMETVLDTIMDDTILPE